MKFLYPDFLLALSAIAIPIVIHLFNFRRFKKIYFSNVRFLREVKQETQSRSRLKHLLVLATRILAITFMVLAFAQPYVPEAEKKTVAGQHGISVFVDNSFSMDAVSQEGRLFDLAKQYAFEIGNSFGTTDGFQLLTNDFEGRHHRTASKEDFSAMVDEINLSPQVKNLSEVISRQKATLNEMEAGARTLFVVSDFQESIADFSTLEADTSFDVRLIPLQPSPTTNLYIDSVWFENPVHQVNTPQELSVRIRNLSDEPFENVPIKLLINGQQKALASADIGAFDQIDTVLVYTPTESGVQQAKVSITDYPITFDDHFFFSYSISDFVPVLEISTSADTGGFIGNLLGKDPFFQLDRAAENSLDYSTLPEYGCIVLNGLNIISSGLAGELNKFVSNGGSLLVFPGANADLDAYEQLLSGLGGDYFTQMDTAATKVVAINADHRLYRNVFESIPDNINLPQVNKHYRFTQQVATNKENLMTLQNGHDFMASYAYGKGQVYVCAVPLSENSSNFPRHAVFVPTVYNACLFSQTSDQLFYTIGLDEQITLDRVNLGSDQVLHLRSEELGTDVIPEMNNALLTTRLMVHNQVTEAGNYLLEHNGAPIAGVAFNYERKESDLRTLDKEGLQALIDQFGLTNFSILDADYKLLTKTLADISRGKHYWVMCIWLALGFLALEVLILKFWK